MIQKIIRAMIGIFGFVLGFTVYSSLANTFPALLFGMDKNVILISIVVGINYRSYILFNRTLGL